ncbi:tetratricopeptide repeat protein [Streptomyces doebereineriae]|uniref:Tetratricopeptide repeat protein n=1 Tax=Streptomyces doebereineriae TaxID=3075528 RepID=A0ABU2VEN0_9ACTN|nr:tetratricopeptide repeat protein [Streptomyces sp. DSM 41640]MDT0483808.1 tetratricopeptide repeat protein [Streptomyces sp. DSM 41640]
MDYELRRQLQLAETEGGLVLLVGDSTAGKTRAAYEAMHAELPERRVARPTQSRDLFAAVDVMGRTAVPSVLWLDDLERFLGNDGLDLALLDELIRLRLPAIATMRLQQYEKFSPQNRDRAGAQVLRAIDPINIPRIWSAEELGRAAECDDGRIVEALTRHGPYGIAEYVAAGPFLLAELDRARQAAAGHARGAALVMAAIDLARTGLHPPYSLTLLTALHEHHLSAYGGALLRPEPLEDAIRWATEIRYGVTSLLLPAEDPQAWDVFDYLKDHIKTSVPRCAWTAALEHATGEDQFAVGLAAAEAEIYDIAEAAWRPLAAKSLMVAHNLGVLMCHQEGRETEAEAFFRAALADGYKSTATNLGLLLSKQQGREVEAEKFLRDALDHGHGVANNLGLLLVEQQGREREAEEFFLIALSNEEAADANNNLGRLLSRQEGREDEAEAYLRAALAMEEPTHAIYNLGLLLYRQEDRRAEAEEYLRRALASGDTQAAYFLGDLLSEQEGRETEAEELLRAALVTDLASTAAYDLGQLMMHAGRQAEAEAMYRFAVERGNASAANNLGNILSKQEGQEAETEDLYRVALASDTASVDAAYNLGIFLSDQPGRESEAEELYRTALKFGHEQAAKNLGHLLARQPGREGETENYFRLALSAGDPDAAFNLGVLLAEQEGREDEAEKFYRMAYLGGDDEAANNLGLLLARQKGREAEAERFFSIALAAGDPYAAENLEILRWLTG